MPGEHLGGTACWTTEHGSVFGGGLYELDQIAVSVLFVQMVDGNILGTRGIRALDQTGFKSRILKTGNVFEAEWLVWW
jgi:hypothetical protein